MSYFTKKIHSDENGLTEFYFNRIFTAAGLKYHISALSKTGIVINFTMQEKHDRWGIIAAPQPPEWIMNLENILSATIIMHLVKE